MRLLIVLGHLHDNGGVRVDLELTRQWNMSGVSARVFALQAGQGAEAPVARIVPVHYGTGHKRRLRYAWPLILARLIRASREADFVISGSEIGVALYFAYAGARLTGRRFAIIVHSSLKNAMVDWVPESLHSLTRFIHRHADATSCVSIGVVPELLDVGVPSQRLKVIPNGIDIDHVRNLSQQPPLPPDGRATTIVSIGRLSSEKNFDVLIRAHALVRQAGVAHRLVIIGDGPDREALLELVGTLGVTDSVDLPGFKANPFPLLAKADLFCLPSRYEGFPLSLLEALALGVPTVATGCGSELLAEGKYGDLVTAGSAEELAACIERHLRDPTRLRTAALLCPSQARHYAWPRIADEYLRFLSGMTGCSDDSSRQMRRPLRARAVDYSSGARNGPNTQIESSTRRCRYGPVRFLMTRHARRHGD